MSKGIRGERSDADFRLGSLRAIATGLFQLSKESSQNDCTFTVQVAAGIRVGQLEKVDRDQRAMVSMPCGLARPRDRAPERDETLGIFVKIADRVDQNGFSVAVSLAGSVPLLLLLPAMGNRSPLSVELQGLQDAE